MHWTLESLSDEMGQLEYVWFSLEIQHCYKTATQHNTTGLLAKKITENALITR